MMDRFEKSIFILSKTNDGDDLSPLHLALVQAACNNQLTAAGEKEFVQLFDRIEAGVYAMPWLHGVENLTRRHSGSVLWRDIEVEHFTFADPDDERKAAISLAERCLAAEARGFPVNGETIDHDGPFKDAPAGTVWFELLMHVYAYLKCSSSGKSAVILSLPDGSGAIELSIVCGEIVLRYAWGCLGVVDLFRQLEAEGFTSMLSRPYGYQPVVDFVTDAGITPDHVSRALRADISKLQRRNFG
jgi:hypothetical protein